MPCTPQRPAPSTCARTIGRPGNRRSYRPRYARPPPEGIRSRLPPRSADIACRDRRAVTVRDEMPVPVERLDVVLIHTTRGLLVRATRWLGRAGLRPGVSRWWPAGAGPRRG